jgi:hypothetical protein
MQTTIQPSRSDRTPPATVTVGRAVHVRRRLALVLALVVFVMVTTMALGGSGAGAELADPVAGHAVVAPGETLWDVAVASAPPGVDARQQVRAIQELNGLDGADLAAWSVLLLPAR